MTKYTFHIPLTAEPPENLVQSCTRMVKRVAAKHGFTCEIRSTQYEGNNALACETEDLAGFLRLRFHFGNDTLNPSENFYPLQEEQCQMEWLRAASSVLDRIGISEFSIQPPRIVFNWLSHLVEFAEAVRGMTVRSLNSELPELPGPYDFNRFDTSGRMPS